jgi:hypothetical protein
MGEVLQRIKQPGYSGRLLSVAALAYTHLSLLSASVSRYPI